MSSPLHNGGTKSGNSVLPTIRACSSGMDIPKQASDSRGHLLTLQSFLFCSVWCIVGAHQTRVPVSSSTVWDAQGWGREARPPASAEVVTVKPRSLLPQGLCMCSSTWPALCLIVCLQSPHQPFLPRSHLLGSTPSSVFLKHFTRPPSGPTTSLICSSPLPPHRLCLLCVSVPSGCRAEGRCSINANLKPWALYNGSQHTVGCICGSCRASVGMWGSFPCSEWSQTHLQSPCREP